MRRLLLRAAVITGGCAAGILLGLAASNPAHADNQPPRPLDGIGDTITDVIDTVLPPQPAPKPDEPDQPPAPPARPVEDIVEEVVDEVEDVVDDVLDTIPQPPATPVDNPTQPPLAQPPTADQPAAAPDSPPVTEPQPSSEPEPTSSPAPQPAADGDPTPETAAVNDIGYHQTAHPHIADDREKQATAEWRAAIRALTALRRDLRAADYTTPAPPQPQQPGHKATGSIPAPHAPTIGIDLPATITGRATQPRTTSARIPGHDQAPDSLTHRPDAPSG